MKRLNPEKLHVTYLNSVTPEALTLPRRHTLTHSDFTGELFLSIGGEYDTKQISRLYTKLMRDEVLAVLCGEGDSPVFRVYCHVSGGFVIGTAKWRRLRSSMNTQISLEKESKSLSDFIEYYEICNRAEDKSPKTEAWYTANLKSFHNYLKNRHLPDTWDKIDIKVLRQYVLYLLKKNKYYGHPITPEKKEFLSASSVHGHVRTLRAFFGWLLAEGLIEVNPAKDLKPPKVYQKVISTLSDDEIRAILALFTPMNSSNARNQTIFMLMLDTGLRMGELINLKIDDIHMNQGLLKALGKGKKERIVPMGSNAQRALQRYLFRYRPRPFSTSIDNVFLSVMGKPLTENGVKLIFSRLAKRSGITRLHAHLCRHTFATRFLINGGDVFTLQQMLGHSTLEMVRHYVNLASNHVAIQHQKYSPLDRLNLRKK